MGIEELNGHFYVGNTATKRTAGKAPDQLDMNDFLNLLVAELTNQDIMNPSSNTEFVAQLATFSSLSGIQTLQDYSLSSYAVSYVGKYVQIANQDEKTGKITSVYGQVERVTFFEGQPKVQVDGKTYDLYKVMEVSSSPITPPPDKPGSSEDGDGEDPDNG